ncbi:endonuclease/exonuclease/phosphatase family protein [Agarivorans sp. Z349TD_8]|uniref:endonuclease/exonuclease/phosphatase family protein n=1 Tax=Agarivorans sp. Z349TD_8 TaxID=3421434 RepID=UPI003D7C7D5D
MTTNDELNKEVMLHKSPNKLKTFWFATVIRCFTVILLFCSIEAQALWTGCENQSLEYTAASAEFAPRPPNKTSFYLLVWNSYKGQQHSWLATLSQLSQQADFILLQEASRKQMRLWPDRQQWYRYQAIAFEWLGDGFGVMNLAKQASLDSCVVLRAEPWIRVPKSALIQHYHWQGKDLLLVNIHSINFTWGEQDYREQLQQLNIWLASYEGPMILAGDFNTWSSERLTLLKQLAHQYQLNEVIFRPDQRSRFYGQALDHIFYRGLKLDQSKSIVSDASDHNALWAKFSFTKHSLQLR